MYREFHWLQVCTTMLQVLAILSTITCFLTNNVLAQQSPVPQHCTQPQSYQPENSCYLTREIISINNDSCTPRSIASITYDRNNIVFTITFNQDYISVREQRLRVTMLKLCHEEALQLTMNDLECTLTCTTEIFRDIENSFSVKCGSDFSDIFLTGNRTIIAFRPIESCQNSSVNLVLIDTDDINECIDMEIYNCSQNAECLDEKCGYSCQCKSGYYIGKDNYTCLADIEIAFEMVEYTVSESVGNVEIEVSVISTDLTFPPITIQISSKNGSATGGMDFHPVTLNITFSPGNQSSLVSIEVINDSENETSETFTLHLTSFSSGVIIDTPNATVTIVDNDNKTKSASCDLEQCLTMISNGNLTNGERMTIVGDIVEELINMSKPSLMPSSNSLQLIIKSLTVITEALENINSTDRRIIEIFNNLLDPNQSTGWRNVLSNGHANTSEILLHSAERYAMLLATTSNSNSEVQSRSNIVVRSMQYSEPPSSVILFPIEADLINFTRARKSEASITIPQSLIQERMNDGRTLPVAFILFHNLPTADFAETELVSRVVSAQVGMAAKSLALLNNPVLLNFGIEATSGRNGSSFVCVYWNYSQPFGNGSWVNDNVTTKCISTSDNLTSVTCASTHLTSFAVLVDVAGALEKVSTNVQFALEVVSYIGCAVSIICLIATVGFFLLQGKMLFDKIHYFVHLNLALTLLLANLVFVSCIETVAVNEIACAFVAALLHYLFLSAFCWMLCEGIMLYLLLVVVFGSSSHKIWIFMIIGYVLPLPVVIVTVSIRYQDYGVKSECDQLLYCWLSTKHGTIYGFVGPMLAIISANVLFLLIALRVLWRSKSQQLKRSQGSTKADVKRVRALMIASVVLLPLLGLTWAFGVLTVNEHAIAFAWLFTIFNSLQGVFLFFFHVLRSEKVQTRINSKLQTLKGTLSSRYSSTRWSNSTTRVATENASTCEISSNQMPMDKEKDDSQGATAVFNMDIANDEQHKTVDEVTPTKKESNGHDCIQYATSRPVIERVLSDGSMIIDMQVDMTTQKMTVLKLNQLLRRTRKLLTTSQEIMEETMETNMDSNDLEHISSEMIPEK